MEGLGLGHPKEARACMRTVCNTCADAQSEPAQTHSMRRSVVAGFSVNPERSFARRPIFAND